MRQLSARLTGLLLIFGAILGTIVAIGWSLVHLARRTGCQ
jgi:hypothetical protein